MSGFESVHRSVAEWVYAALASDEWTLKDERSEVEDEDRPVVIVEPTGEKATPFARTSYTQGDVQHRDTWTVTAYPVTDGAPQECTRRARLLAEALDAAVTYGILIPADDPEPERQLGGPLTLPLWDFEGLGLGDPRPDDPAGTVFVESHTARPIADPLDDRRWTVVLEMRVTWWWGGRIRRDTAEPPITAKVDGTYEER